MGSTRFHFKQSLFWCLALMLCLGVSLMVLWCADLWVHSKVDRSGGLNSRGYRGKVVGKKEAGVFRIMVLGGSTTFGYGVTPQESFPAYLQERLEDDIQTLGPVSPFKKVEVVNLGLNSMGVWAFDSTLDAYENLEADAVIFYNGYNDLTQHHLNRTSRDSAIFKWLGYYPILPLALKEKAGVLKWGKGHAKLSEKEKLKFEVPVHKKAAALGMEMIASVGTSIEEKLGQVGELPPSQMDEESQQLKVQGKVCGDWALYCGAYQRAVDKALGQGKLLLAVRQPELGKIHRSQQEALALVLDPWQKKEPQLETLDLSQALLLEDPLMSFDRMHLTALGNQRIAQAMAPKVMEILMTAGKVK